MKPSIRSMLKSTFAALPLVLAAALILVGLGCGSSDSPFHNGVPEPPPGNATPTSTFGASGQFTNGANAGKAFVLTFQAGPSGDTTVIIGTLEILGSPVQLDGSIDPTTKHWKMTGSDPKTGIKYTVDLSGDSDGLPGFGQITDSSGGAVGVLPQAQ